MKLNKLSYIAVAVAFTGLTACDDFLDAAPDERVTIDSPEKVSLLLVDAYPGANLSGLCEFSSDNVVDNNSPDENGMRYNLSYFDRQDLEAYSWEDVVSNMDTESPSYLWEAYYHSIAVANEALKAIAEMEAQGRGDEVQAQKGEALMCRAYNHFLLANLFSMHYAGEEASKQIPSVPYMDKVEDKVLVNYEREPLQSVYAKIEKDILDGYPLINDGSYSVPKYHFNKKAAAAFAARFYLYKRDYVNAEKWATEALGGESGNPAGMMRTFWSKTFTTPDALVAAYTSAQEQSNLMLVATYSTFFRRRGERFALNREAKDATIYCEGPTWSTALTNYYCHPCYSGKIYVRGSQEYGLFFPKSYEIFEYTDKVAGIGFVHIVRCEFTAEEVLLTRAEARIWQNNLTGALEDLRTWDESRQKIPVAVNFPQLTDERIRDFYKEDKGGFGIVKPLNIDRVNPVDGKALNANIEPYLQCVLHFRRIETIDDGLRWFDIKRYGIEITHKIGATRIEHLTWNDPRRAFQIPAEVIAAGFAPNDRKPALIGEGANCVQLPNSALMAK